MNLQDVYFDKSIRDYALKLTGNEFDADDLVSIAFEICSSKPTRENLKGYFAVVMRNQWYKKCKKSDIVPSIADTESEDVESTLDRMYHYYSDILTAIYNGEKLTEIHKGSGIPYGTLKEDYAKAKKEFKILHKQTKIALIVSSDSGVTYHRLNTPFSKLKQDYGIDVEIHYNEDDSFIHRLEDVTHVVYSRNISRKMQPEKIIGTLQLMGIKVICDVDDYWVLPQGHPTRALYKSINYSKCQVRNIQLADSVWTTTPQLADKIKQYNKNVHVVKNAIWKQAKQFNPQEVSLNFDTFFYSGGKTHLSDLKLIGKSFNDEELFVKTPNIPKSLECHALAVSDIHNYANDYHTSGISIIPLRQTLFNSLKSELKMIESGHFCKPVMVSNVEPYTNLATGKNCIKVLDNDWAKAIKRIKGERNLQVDLGMKLKEDVEAKYNLDKENRLRIQLL